MERSKLSDDLFHGQSVLVVDRFEDVSEEILGQFIKWTRNHRREKVFAAYWMKKLHKERRAIKKNG